MLLTPQPKPVRKAQKVLFPYLVEHFYHRPLDDFVLQCSDPQWPFPTIGFWYPDSSRRFRMICPPMDPSVQVGEPLLQVDSIGLPRHPVHSRRCLPFQVVVAAPEQCDIDVMQQGGEP